jgi:predicted Holliday junction resolvase-like endonuclease
MVLNGDGRLELRTMRRACQRRDEPTRYDIVRRAAEAFSGQIAQRFAGMQQNIRMHVLDSRYIGASMCP